MDWDCIEGHWKQIRGKVKARWGMLTDDDVGIVAGQREQLAGKIQVRHGRARENSGRRVTDWARRTEKSGRRQPSLGGR